MELKSWDFLVLWLVVSRKEDSDIDICVKLQDPDYFTRMEIKESLEERFNAKVDVVSLTAIMRSLFRNHIEKDAIYI